MMNSATPTVRTGAVPVRQLRHRVVMAYAVVGLFGLGWQGQLLAEDEANTSTANRSEPRTVISASPAEITRSTAEAVAEKIGEPTFRRIGPVTTITEVSSGLPFPARVDTGATTCSIHYEEIVIDDPAEKPEDNVGKVVRVLIQNPDGKKEWISTKIADHVTVRTSTDDEQRYKVPMKLRWEDVEKKVLVTLKDRERMTYPLLLGRNFLKGDFLVDVNLDVE